MDPSERNTKLAELHDLRLRVRELEQELQESPPHWQADEFYLAYYATAGFMLGMIAAAASLLFNIVGSLAVGQHWLKLIQVYLTFPLGEQGLQMDGWLALTIGCCLYLGTGMILGVPFYVLLHWLTRNGTLANRITVASALAISMWLVHFYGILIWLQPLLFGGNWIVDQIPWIVGMLTHLVYGWTMVAVYPLGRYTPYRRQTDHNEDNVADPAGAAN